METIGAILFGVIGLAFVIWLWIIVPANMAANGKRSSLIWVLISFVGSPLLAILLLYALGDPPESKAT